MDRILPCDWLPEWDRWSYLACSRLPAVSCKKNFSVGHVINPSLTELVRSRWLDIGIVLFLASLWTSTVSVHQHAKIKRLANIQPSWPYTWSITHIYCTRAVMCAVNCVAVQPAEKKCLRLCSSWQYLLSIYVLYKGKLTWMKEGHSQSCKGLGCDL